MRQKQLISHLFPFLEQLEINISKKGIKCRFWHNLKPQLSRVNNEWLAGILINRGTGTEKISDRTLDCRRFFATLELFKVAAIFDPIFQKCT